MYDKYSKANPITSNTQLPKGSKGLLVSNSSATPTGLTMHLYQVSGGTFQTTLSFAAGTSVLPVEVHSIPGAFGGLTAFYLV